MARRLENEEGCRAQVGMSGCWVSVSFWRIGRLRAVRSKFLPGKQAGNHLTNEA